MKCFWNMKLTVSNCKNLSILEIAVGSLAKKFVETKKNLLYLLVYLLVKSLILSVTTTVKLFLH